jgi:hypothetical protein
MYTGVERRRRNLPGRFARATYPAREAIGGFVRDLPCNVIGHHWIEIPRAERRVIYRDPRRMRFKCSRCRAVTGYY